MKNNLNAYISVCSFIGIVVGIYGEKMTTIIGWGIIGALAIWCEK